MPAPHTDRLAVEHAARIVDGAIATLADGYDTYQRDVLVRAVAEGRPAILTLGSYHNQGAANLCSDVNHGEATVTEVALRWAKDRGRRFAEDLILKPLRPLNPAGAEQIEAAWFALADTAPSSKAA